MQDQQAIPPTFEPLMTNNSREFLLIPTRKETFTVLVIGETGSGKTAFVDLLINLLHGNGPFDLQDFHDQSKESGLSRNQSQTSKATLYDIPSACGRMFHILDTPGLADTRGIEQDKVHKEEINNAIQNHIASIDAVVITANGTGERLTAATDYTLNIINSMFPHSILDNIGIILTHSESLGSNFDPQSLQPELQQVRRWEIQNPLALLRKYRANLVGYTNKQRQRHERNIQECYENTLESINNWLVWMDERRVQPTIEIDRLYRISMDIESHIESTLATIASLLDQRVLYKKILSDLQNAGKTRISSLEALKQLGEPVWERDTTEKYNTICITPDCHSNCHQPCELSYTEDHTSLGRWCQVFKKLWPLPSWSGAEAECIKCKHPAKDHRHYKQIHVQKARKGDAEKLALKLADDTNDEQMLRRAKTTAENKLTEIQENISSAQDAIHILVDRYNEASLSRNFAGHIRSAIQMLKLRKDELRTKANKGVDQLVIVDGSIKKLEDKLRILARNDTAWNKITGVFDNGRHYIEDPNMADPPQD